MKVSSPKDRNPIVFFQDVVREIVQEDPKHKFHIGKILLNSMRKNPSDTVIQVDAAEETIDTSGELLARSVGLAQVFRNIGLQVGDVVTVMGRNHIDIVVPMFAALFNGLAFNGVDGDLKKNEMENLLRLARPKIVFCESSNISMLSEINEELHFRIVSFTVSQDHRYPTLKRFIEQHRGDENCDDFKAADVDPNTTTAFIFCTSGTTGLPKLADVTHANYAPGLGVIWTSSGPATGAVGPGVCVGPVYWLTCVHFHLQTAIYAVTKIQTSAQLSPSHIADIVQKYRPSLTAMTPGLASQLLKRADAMDWTCFHTFIVAGSVANKDLIDALNGGGYTLQSQWLWDCNVDWSSYLDITEDYNKMAATLNVYGLTECCCRVFWMPDNTVGTLGVPVPGLQCKIVDTKTGNELGDNEPGELYIKGPNVFRGYYNDALSTKEAFTVDNWFKTGDLMYRNSNQHYCFVDRLKIMLDVHLDGVHYHISPAEIEREIKKLPSVSEVAVAGVMRGDAALPLALVVRNAHSVTADDIIEHVKNNLSPPKHLTGGVMFVAAIPLNSIGKFDRMKIKEIANVYYNNNETHSLVL